MIHIEAYLNDGKKITPFLLHIDDPVPIESDIETCYCEISAPLLREKKFKIYGVSAEQAKQLAVEFIIKLLGNSKLEDAQGNPVHLQWM
jgi:hypothetical protein